jgi:hypothetical protein
MSLSHKEDRIRGKGCWDSNVTGIFSQKFIVKNRKAQDEQNYSVGWQGTIQSVLLIASLIRLLSNQQLEHTEETREKKRSNHSI